MLPIAALLLTAAGASAGWTPARDLPSGDTFAPDAATAGRGTEVVGYADQRGGAAVARFPSGRLTAPAIVQRSGYDEAEGIEVDTSRTGRSAAAWSWFDASFFDDDARIECCDRAVVATWARGRKPRRQVLSAEGTDIRDVTVAMRPDGRAVVAWQMVDTGAVMVALERADGSFGSQRVDSGPDRNSHSQDVTVAADRDGRVLVNWIEGGLGGPVRFMGTRIDAAGQAAPERELGVIGDLAFASYDLLTDESGGQLLVWTDLTNEDDSGVFAAYRSAEGFFSRVRQLGRATIAGAALGSRGHGVVVWTLGSRAWVSQRRPGHGLSRPRRLPPDVRAPAAGVDARGRLTLLYRSGGRIRARRGPYDGRLGHAATVSRVFGDRNQCSGSRLDVAPGGDAVALWECVGRRRESRLQAAVYRR